MKTRRIFCFLLSIILCLTAGFPVYGLEAGLEEKSISVVYNNSVTSVDVLVDSEQNIYMTTESISKLTPFSFSANESSFFYDDQIEKTSCTKEISISAESSTATIINYWLNTMPVVANLSSVYQYNDKLYLPIAELFPCLDTIIEVTDGKLIIMPVTSTVSRALCNVNLDDYLFNMYYTETKAAGFICTLYEDLSHLRVSRLPIIRNAVRYTEIKHYEDVFTDYLLDNSVYTAAMNDIVDSKETIARSLINGLDNYKKDLDTSKFFYLPSWIASVVIDRNAMDESEKWGFDKKVERTLGTIDKISDGFYDAVSVYTAYQFHVADNLSMLNAVYDLKEKSYKYSLFMSKDKTEAHAAQKIYEEYSNGLLVALLNSVSDTAFENIADLIKDKATDKICELLGARFNSFLVEIERILINKMFPSFATTSGNLEILPYHYKIANTALSDFYTGQRLNLGVSNSGETINRARLQLILYLTSSKYCYKAIQNSADAYKDKGFSNLCEKHIKQIDELLSKLYLAAFSIDYDSYEKLEESINANRQAIINLEIYEPVNAFDLYKQFFENNHQLSDLVCLADVTHDGIDEMIVITEINDEANIYQGIVYSIIDGNVTKIYEKSGGSDHASGFFNWYLTCNDGIWNLAEEYFNMWQGQGETGFKEYYLNSNGEIIENKLVYIPQSTDDVDNDGVILDSVFDNYVNQLTAVINNSYRIIYCHSEAWEAEPHRIETNPGIVFGVEKNKQVSIDEISSLSKIQLNIPAYVIGNGGLNLRTGPSESNQIITLIPKKTKLNVISVIDNYQDLLNGFWVYVDYNGQKGYVNSGYLSFETQLDMDNLSSEQIFVIGMILYHRYLSDTHVLSLPSVLKLNYDIEVLVDDTYENNNTWYRKILPQGLHISDIESAYIEEFSKKYHTPSYSQYFIEHDGYVWEPFGFGGDVEFDYSELVKLNKITETEIEYTIREHCRNVYGTQIEVDVDFSIVYEDDIWKCGKITVHA